MSHHSNPISPPLLILASEPDRTVYHVLECLDQWQTPYYFVEGHDRVSQITVHNLEDQVHIAMYLETARGTEILQLHEVKACWHHSGCFQPVEGTSFTPHTQQFLINFLRKLPVLRSNLKQEVPYLVQCLFAHQSGVLVPPFTAHLTQDGSLDDTLPILPEEEVEHELEIFFLGEKCYPVMLAPAEEDGTFRQVPFLLPADVEGHLMLMMEKMDLSVGIIRMTVSRKHQYYYRGIHAPESLAGFYLAGYRSLPEDIAEHLTQMADLPAARIRRLYHVPKPGSPQARPGTR